MASDDAPSIEAIIGEQRRHSIIEYRLTPEEEAMIGHGPRLSPATRAQNFAAYRAAEQRMLEHIPGRYDPELSLSSHPGACCVSAQLLPSQIEALRGVPYVNRIILR